VLGINPYLTASVPGSGRTDQVFVPEPQIPPALPRVGLHGPLNLVTGHAGIPGGAGVNVIVIQSFG
jgi:hypothetical protein